MRNKVTSLLAATLCLVAVALFGFQEIGGRALIQAAFYAVLLSAPLLALAWKYKDELLKIKHGGPIGMLVGTLAWKVLWGYSKFSLLVFALMIAYCLYFFAIIYTDKELEPKAE